MLKRSMPQEQELQQTMNKRMKAANDNNNKRVRFQEEVETLEHDRLPQHEAVQLWYCRQELNAIHKEIFVSLSESKNGSLSDFEFSARGLEEIRKRKPHKRQVRRDEYISSVIALYRKQRQVGQVCPEEIQRFAMNQSRSAKLRAQHYGALDAEEAGAVFQETFSTTSRMMSASATKDSHESSSRRVAIPSTNFSFTHNSMARSA